MFQARKDHVIYCWFFGIISWHRLWEIATCKPYYRFPDKELHGTYSLDGDHQQRSGRRTTHDCTRERQVQIVAAAVECLIKQNNDLEEKLRQKNVGHNTQEEDQEGTNAERRDQERLEGSNDWSRLERQDTSHPSITDTALPHMVAEM